MKNITQEVTINASPDAVYDALMDEKKHAEFTGSKAKIANKVGGKFEVWDGYASGRNVELVKGKKIVQSWRADDWPKDAVSELIIELTPSGKGTKLQLSQKNIPDDFAGEVKQGWTDYYWQPLKKYLKK